MWVWLQLWNWSYSCRCVLKNTGTLGETGEELEQMHLNARTLPTYTCVWLGDWRKWAVINPFIYLIVTCIRPQKSYVVHVLTMTEWSSWQRDLTDLLRGFHLRRHPTFFSFSPLTLKNTACSHTRVDAANVVFESRQRYNYHRSANQCVYHRNTQWRKS